ncbi:MAG: nitrilase-related carbon-nitrogen hydrolase [Xanthobacteraceae bacterium]|jgi:nitrilase
MDRFADLIVRAANSGGIKPYIAACVQAAPVAFDVARTLEKVRELAAAASRTGAKLILFPEAFVSAYPRGANFGATIGGRSMEGREQFRRYHAASIDVPGPAVDALAAVAKQNSVHLVIGAIERHGGTLYCTVLFFADDGTLLGKHRKLMPTGSERLVWGFGDGSTLSVYDTAIGRLGAVICWENYMPMLRAAMYAQRIQVYCAPTADGRQTWLPSMQHVALEGRCFVLSTNQFCRRRDYPVDYVAELPKEPDAIVSRGGACIIDPLGNVLAGPLWDREGIITAEIDLNAATRALFDFDPVGHYSRPDVFSLTVDRRAKPAVNFD